MPAFSEKNQILFRAVIFMTARYFFALLRVPASVRTKAAADKSLLSMRMIFYSACRQQALRALSVEVRRNDDRYQPESLIAKQEQHIYISASADEIQEPDYKDAQNK